MNIRSLLATFVWLIPSSSGYLKQDEPTPFQAIVLDQVTRYPHLEVQDLYKFTFQAAMGNEHLMTDTTMISNYLYEELASLSPRSSEPLIEIMTPDSSLVRINLRPFKIRNGNAALLVRSMLTTARNFVRSQENLRTWWKEIIALAERHLIPFSQGDLKSYFAKVESDGFPAVHHSEVYERLYHPAYRVLAKKTIPPFPASTTGQ